MMNRPSLTVLAAVALIVLGSAATIAQNNALYTPTQAAAGAKVYAESCARCHGADLSGVSGPALKGADLSAPGAQGKLTISDIFKYTRDMMPAGNPGSLSYEQYVDVMAFILRENGNPSGSEPLSSSVALHANDPISKK